jgi:hypothetical protein
MEKVIKILRDLAYRIQVSRKDDPERENAIRLRDRLLAKYGLKLEDIQEVRKTRVLDKLTLDEMLVVRQFFGHHLKIDPGDGAPYNLNCYVIPSKTSVYKRLVEIDLTDDEYSKFWPQVKALVALWRREAKALEEKLKEEANARRAAFKWKFCEKADILMEAKEGEVPREPGYGLRDLMAAAAALDDVIFPHHYVGEEQKRLGAPESDV